MSVGKSKLPKKPRSQTWSIITLLVVITSIIYLSKTRATISISERGFEAMMLSKDVKEVVLIANQNIVEITLKPEAFTKEPIRPS